MKAREIDGLVFRVFT